VFPIFAIPSLKVVLGVSNPRESSSFDVIDNEENGES
jgi:hypothetical protein